MMDRFPNHENAMTCHACKKVARAAGEEFYMRRSMKPNGLHTPWEYTCATCFDAHEPKQRLDRLLAALEPIFHTPQHYQSLGDCWIVPDALYGRLEAVYKEVSG